MLLKIVVITFRNAVLCLSMAPHTERYNKNLSSRGINKMVQRNIFQVHAYNMLYTYEYTQTLTPQTIRKI